MKRGILKMDKILNFQVSLFGRFIDIKPKTDIILKLLTNLQDEAFIPGTVDLAVLDPMTKKITTDSRIQMISQNKAWSIVFLEERIDFNYNFQPDTMSIKKIVDAYEYIKKLIEKVFSVFPDTTGNRIAFNGKILLNEMTDEEIDRFMNKFSSPLSIYNNKKLTEWAVRFNSREQISWDNHCEECNCITEISKIINVENADENRMLITVDLNTIQQNMDLRFKYGDMLQFSEKAKEISENIVDEIEGN